MSLISLTPKAKALGDVKKAAASPPRVGDLRAQFCSPLRLRPWVMRIRLPLHHLEEVACEINLLLHQG